MPIFDNFHDVCHMFSYLSTPRSLYDSKHNNASSLATACGDKPAHRCYGHVRVAARTVSRIDVTHRRTDRKIHGPTYPHPPKTHPFLTHPLLLFALRQKTCGWKKLETDLKVWQSRYVVEAGSKVHLSIHYILITFHSISLHLMFLMTIYHYIIDF